MREDDKGRRVGEDRRLRLEGVRLGVNLSLGTLAPPSRGVRSEEVGGEGRMGGVS